MTKSPIACCGTIWLQAVEFSTLQAALHIFLIMTVEDPAAKNCANYRFYLVLTSSQLQ
jgi:hypothetical protein